MKTVIANTNRPDVISIAEVDKNKLYFASYAGVIYKLHRLSVNPDISCKYAFVSMLDSCCWSCGGHPTMARAIEVQKQYGDVYEFDTLKEAMEKLL